MTITIHFSETLNFWAAELRSHLTIQSRNWSKNSSFPLRSQHVVLLRLNWSMISLHQISLSFPWSHHQIILRISTAHGCDKRFTCIYSLTILLNSFGTGFWNSQIFSVLLMCICNLKIHFWFRFHTLTV